VWTGDAGAGGSFGDSSNDSHVYVGGLPSSYWRRMSALTAPSTMFVPRLNGYVRNLLYGNCSCARRRAGLPLGGDGYTTLPGTDELCDLPGVRHNCTRRCLCISTDRGPACHCPPTTCNRGTAAACSVLRQMDRWIGRLGQLSFASLLGRLIEYRLRLR